MGSELHYRLWLVYMSLVCGFSLGLLAATFRVSRILNKTRKESPK